MRNGKREYSPVHLSKTNSWGQEICGQCSGTGTELCHGLSRLCLGLSDHNSWYSLVGKLLGERNKNINFKLIWLQYMYNG